MESSNPARRGPKKVWKGYKNLRVPIELFDDVKAYLEERKAEYFAQIDGIEIPSKKPALDMDTMEQMMRQVVENVLAEHNPKPVSSPESVVSRLQRNLTPKTEPPADLADPSKMNSRDRLLHTLKKNKGKQMTTTELAKLHGMAGPTARQAARELADEHDQVILIPGRPNKIQYIGN